MQTFRLQFSDIVPDMAEVYLNLGYKGSKPDAHVEEMLSQIIAEVSAICRPEAGYIFCEGKVIDKNHLELNGVSMKTGPIINGYLTDSTRFAVFVATAGQAFDDYLHQLKEKGDIMHEFLADSLGSEIAEATVRYVAERIEEVAVLDNSKITKSYSPGYCGWHVREQKSLFSILPDEPCGIKLNDSSLMHPVKSVSGIVGVGKEVVPTPYACEICGMQTCYKRKTEAQPALSDE
jgi:hypothetical protein